MQEIVIFEAQTSLEFEKARQLFKEYATTLNFDLHFQDFAHELDMLSQMYSPPNGCLLLARRNGKMVGCVALRKFKDDVCEMKRLYVRPQVRETRLGKELTKRIIQKAIDLGYKRMVLDTLKSMEPARRLYYSLGFRERLPYYENPISDAIYMELDLNQDLMVRLKK